MHHLGLKFGLYVTPGISKQAVAQNTPIEGTSYTADQIAEPSVTENNYNCGGMVGIDYSKPGAQAFIDSWADEFASWGVDYLKLDGVGSFDIPDVQAWSQALRQTGRPIHLELSNSLNIADASTWAQYSNGWRTGGDIECYGCETERHQLPADRLGQRRVPVRPGRAVAAGRRAGRVQRLRLAGAGQRQQRRADPGGTADPDEPVVAGRLAAHPGHRPDPP